MKLASKVLGGSAGKNMTVFIRGSPSNKCQPIKVITVNKIDWLQMGYRIECVGELVWVSTFNQQKDCSKTIFERVTRFSHTTQFGSMLMLYPVLSEWLFVFILRGSL